MAVFRNLRRWLASLRHGYRPVVDRFRPVPRPPELDSYVGYWVAVLDGKVIDAAPTSHQLAVRLHHMDHRKRRRAVVEYVRPAADAYIVGAG
jgi:hypothetical protein